MNIIPFSLLRNPNKALAALREAVNKETTCTTFENTPKGMPV
jgi:hypothetical protein